MIQVTKVVCWADTASSTACSVQSQLLEWKNFLRRKAANTLSHPFPWVTRCQARISHTSVFSWQPKEQSVRFLVVVSLSPSHEARSAASRTSSWGHSELLLSHTKLVSFVKSKEGEEGSGGEWEAPRFLLE